MKLREEDQHTARLPSIFSSSPFSSTSTSSSQGTLDSSAATPLPDSERLNSPSLPSAALDRLDRMTTLFFTVPLQA